MFTTVVNFTPFCSRIVLAPLTHQPNTLAIKALPQGLRVGWAHFIIKRLAHFWAECFFVDI